MYFYTNEYIVDDYHVISIEKLYKDETYTENSEKKFEEEKFNTYTPFGINKGTMFVFRLHK